MSYENHVILLSTSHFIFFLLLTIIFILSSQLYPQESTKSKFYKCYPLGFHTKSTFALFIFLSHERKKKERTKQNGQFFFQETSKTQYTNNNDNKEEEDYILLLYFLFLSKTNIIYETSNDKFVDKKKTYTNIKKKKNRANLIIPIQSSSYIEQK